MWLRFPNESLPPNHLHGSSSFYREIMLWTPRNWELWSHHSLKFVLTVFSLAWGSSQFSVSVGHAHVVLWHLWAAVAAFLPLAGCGRLRVFMYFGSQSSLWIGRIGRVFSTISHQFAIHRNLHLCHFPANSHHAPTRSQLAYQHTYFDFGHLHPLFLLVWDRTEKITSSSLVWPARLASSRKPLWYQTQRCRTVSQVVAVLWRRIPNPTWAHTCCGSE